MEHNITVDGVEYIIYKNDKNYWDIKRADSGKIKNKSKVCRDYLKLKDPMENYEHATGANYLSGKIAKLLGINKAVSKRTKNENTSKNSSNKPQWAYKTTEKSSLSAREFYNKIYELLKEKYHNLVYPNLSMEESNERLGRYFHLTDELPEWVYKDKLHLNFDTPENQRNYLFAQFIYHSGNKSASGLIGFFRNYNVYKDNFNDFNVDSFFNACTDNPNLVKEHIKNILTETVKVKNDKVNKYFNLYKNIADYLHGHNKEYIVNDLYNHYDANDHTSIPNYFLDSIKRGNGFGFALACDYIKELDDRFNYMFKPDLHVIDFLDIYYGLGWKLKKEDALERGIKLVAEINSDGQEAITGYIFDRMIYLLGSGNFFLDNVVQNKTEASKEKWETILPQINNKR